jgi:tRNA pseudouridine38-40 synthase
VKSSEAVDHDFHARFSATWRRYRYLLSDQLSAVFRQQRWHYPYALDFDQLAEAAALVQGEHDFTPFCVVASRKEDNTCRVTHSRWRQVGPLLVYEIRANRFLHNMVRALVGCMVNLGTINPDRNSLNLTLERFRDIMSAPSDERQVFTAPAHGLYLVSVGYKGESPA